MRVALFRLLGHKSDQRPPSSPLPSRSGMEALGAQRSYPVSHACTYRTSHLLLPSLGDGWEDLLRLLVSHFCSRRPVHCSGGEWMTFHSAWGQWSSHPGRRWTAVHPGSKWIPTRFHRGLVEPGLVASQRLP